MSPPPLSSIKRSFRTPPLLELLVEFAVVVLVFALDVRDLSFKTQWIGPKDTFSFTAIGTQVLQKTALAPAFNVTVPGGSLSRASGWGSFLETCDTLHPIGGSFFLHAMGENCRFGPRRANISVPKVVFVSSLRADSVAWAACKLLRADRRPVVCRSRMVLQFEAQYNMAATPFRLEYASRDSSETTRTAVSLEEDSWTSAPGSAAEDEVLELLAVISESAPIGHVVCVEGFIYDGPGRYVASIFGCGSPNRYHSAFVGIHATAMAQFHQNKSWLTADWLHVLGVPLLIRQNCLSLFNVVLSSDGKAGETMTLVHETLMNFSSSGALYVLVILIDVVLLIISLLSTIEILRYIIVPVVKDLRRRGIRADGERHSSSLPSGYEGVLTCPVIRSTSFAVLTLFSQLISWLVVLANSVIWSWTEATPGKIQAYLSTLRFWTIALIACNVLWNALVTLSERRAYEFATRTRVAVVEILFVASAVAYARRDELFAIGGTKYGIEGQRQLDTTSFQGGFLAFGNAYPQRLDGLQVTSGDILKIIYEPLGKMIGWCLFGAAAFAISRYAVNTALMHLNRRNARAAMYVQPSEEPTEVIKSSVAGTSSTSKSSRVAIESTVRDDGPADGDTLIHTAAAAAAQYHRLPFEEALNTPIRARSLLRNTSRMETMASNRQQVCMSALVEHGVIVDNGRLRTRVGFVGTVQDFVLARRYRMRDDRRTSNDATTASILHPLG